MPHMGKKPPEKKQKTTQFQFRCTPDELSEFRAAAEREGFDGISAWLLWHLRRIIRESPPKK